MKKKDKREILPIPINKIRLSPELLKVQKLMPMSQERFNGLYKSIEKNKRIHDPLKCYFQDGFYYILGGMHRFMCADTLKFKTVPVEDYTNIYTTKEDREKFCIEDNLHRRHFDKKEEVRIVKEYIKLNPIDSASTIIKITGTTLRPSSISRIKQQMIHENEIEKPSVVLYKDGRLVTNGQIIQPKDYVTQIMARGALKKLRKFLVTINNQESLANLTILENYIEKRKLAKYSDTAIVKVKK